MNPLIGPNTFVSHYPTFVSPNVDTTQKPMETLSGTLFILSLRAQWIVAPTDEDKGPDRRLMGSFPELFKGKGKYVLCYDVVVESEECENWAEQWDKLEGRFPPYLPVDYFWGKKEGDNIEIDCYEKRKHFSLTFAQAARELESAMETMFMITYNTLSDVARGPFSAEDQKKWDAEGRIKWEMISKMKEEHYPNSTITSRGYDSLVNS